jgi:thymidylate kinase
MIKNRYIIFDGADGVGKTTQLNLLAAVIEQRGATVLKTRAVGGTGMDYIQNELRRLLLNPAFPSTETADEEALFSIADNRNVTQMRTFLDLNDNGVVVQDRGYVSHIAYFAAKGHDEAEIEDTHSRLFNNYSLIANEAGIINVVLVPENAAMALERVKSRGLPVIARLENQDMQTAVIKELEKGSELVEPYGLGGEDAEGFGINNIFITVGPNDSIEAVHQKVMAAVAPLLFETEQEAEG